MIKYEYINKQIYSTYNSTLQLLLWYNIVDEVVGI